MERIPVQSSNVAEIGYESNTSTLEIMFVGGNIYQYFDVPVWEYESLISASSIGTYLNENIKDVYRYVKL